MARADVTVRGGGIFGLSIAWACLGRGARVRVIETAGWGAGSSGGLVGALSPHVPEAWNAKKAFQFESLLMASDWWAAVEAASGLASGYARLGRVQPLPDDRTVAAAHRREGEAATLWQGRAEWRVIPATGADWEPLTPSGWLVRDTLSARLSPRMGLAALIAALRAKGAELVLGEAEEVGAVVHATGTAGLADLSQAFGAPLGSGVKGQALSLRYAASDQPQLFVDGVHIVPHADGTVAIGSTSHLAGKGCGRRASPCREPGRPEMGGHPSQGRQPRAGPGGVAEPPGPLRGKRRVQDWFRHGPEGCRSHGRSGAGASRRNPT